MKRIITILAIFATSFCSAQKIHHITHDAPIDKKLDNQLRYDYTLTSADSCDYQIEVFFKGSYSFWKKGYWGYYKLYDNQGNEIYKSKEWGFNTYGGVAENAVIKKTTKELKKRFKSN